MLKLQLGHLVIPGLQLFGQPVDIPLQRLPLLADPSDLRLLSLVVRLLVVLDRLRHDADHGGLAGSGRSDQKDIQAGLFIVTDVSLNPDLSLQAGGEYAQGDAGCHVHRRLGMDGDCFHIRPKRLRQAVNREGRQFRD